MFVLSAGLEAITVRPRRSVWLPPCLAGCLGRLFDFAEFRYEFLKALHQAAQVVGIDELAPVAATTLDPLDQSSLLEFCNVPLHLAVTQAQPLCEGLLARERFPLLVPSEIAQLQENRELGGIESSALLRAARELRVWSLGLELESERACSQAKLNGPSFGDRLLSRPAHWAQRLLTDFVRCFDRCPA